MFFFRYHRKIVNVGHHCQEGDRATPGGGRGGMTAPCGTPALTFMNMDFFLNLTVDCLEEVVEPTFQ